MKLRKWAASMGVVAALPFSAAATLLWDVDFHTNDRTMSGTAVVGLHDNLGNAGNAITLTYSAETGQGFGFTGGGGNPLALLDDGIGGGSNAGGGTSFAQLTFTFSGLQASTAYKVVAYGANNTDGRGTVFFDVVGGAVLGTTSGFSNDINDGLGGAYTQFIVTTDPTGAFTLFSNFNSRSSANGPVNGFQVESVVGSAESTWTGAGLDSNWSATDNWTDGVPGTGTAVRFFDAGAVAPAEAINNQVDGGFAGTIAALHYGQTNDTHTTAIPAGSTLSVTDVGSLRVGTRGDPGSAITVTATVVGAGGLNLDNAAGNLVINQGTLSSSGSRAILDLAGLNTFTADINRLGLGTTTLPNPANQRTSGTLFLARTNRLTLAASASLAAYETTPSTASAIDVSYNPGNPAGVFSELVLGQTNDFFVDSLRIGGTKSSATSAAVMRFNPVFIDPVAVFRGVGGPSSRVTWWAFGDMGTGVSSAQHATGIGDFTGGRVDALVDTLCLGRDAVGNHTASGGVRVNAGTLTFDDGIIDVNRLILGNQSLGSGTSTTPNLGTMNVAGADAKLVVNDVLILGATVQASQAAQSTSGILNLDGGTVLANRIAVGEASLVNEIHLSNGAILAVSNAIASSTKGVSTLSMEDSTLVYHAGQEVVAVTTNLTTGGATNTLQLASVEVFDTYPAEVTLIDYAGTIGGAGFNFGMGVAPLPTAAPGAYLTNDVANSAIKLILPDDPRPIITSPPAGFAGAPGTDVALAVGYSGVAPFTFQWRRNGSDLTDGATGNGSIIAGSTADMLTLTNAQLADSGEYVVVITNAFGSVTSSPPAVLTISAGDIAPTITGPADLTVVQGDDATFVASVSGVPVPTIVWRKDGVEIPGATNSSLTVTSAQYPDDEGGYAIVATNSQGSRTNSATLTVLVPPLITTHPQDQAVLNGTPAGFAVAATGQPAPTYQWRKNGADRVGETNGTLSIAAASPADIAAYRVLVTNPAGSVLSDEAALIVNSPMSVAAVGPTHTAAGVCHDTPLYLEFDQAPRLRKAGAIRIYSTADTNTPVDTIDLSLNVDNHPAYAANLQPRVIGGETFVSFPVILTGNTAAIYPHAGVMTSNQTYYVIVDPGVFTDPAGAWFPGIGDPAAWQFTTKPAGPADPARLVVAADGSGDFCTVQGAVDSLAPGNTSPTVIHIQDGVYTEIVNINNRHNLALQGESRGGVILTYANNANLQAGTHFRMSFKVNADDISVDSLTIINSTPNGGSQAEALMIESDCKRFIAYNVNICSYQDTILANTSGSQGYFRDSLIQGDTDFIWGGGNLFITNCEIRALDNGGHVTQPRTDAGSNGMSFVQCRLTRAPGVSSFTLGRSLDFTTGNMALVDCLVDSHITGWFDPQPRYWEHGNFNLAGTAPVSFNGTALASDDPNLAMARSDVAWLYGWAPQLRPNILSQPQGISVQVGDPAGFTVQATGIPEPQYQWQKDGGDLPGETNASYSIAAAVAGDAGDYRVIVSNAAGSETSRVAVLELAIPLSFGGSVLLENGDVQVSFGGASGQGFRLWASPDLPLAPVPTTWTLLSNGVFGVGPVQFADPAAAAFRERFYSISVP